MSPDGTSIAADDFLEVTLISAQDLFPSSRSLGTYAVTYLHPSHRLRTRLDSSGHTSPTWNDKFLFRLDSSALLSDTFALEINIFAARRHFFPGPDTLLGSSRAILSTRHLSPSPCLRALHVRRPSSLRPHGILNISIALAHPSSLPLPALAAFAYHDLVSPKNPALPRPPPPAVFDRSGSAGGAGERERVVLEKKLKKWRSEIWAAEEGDQMGWEKGGEGSPVAAATDDEGGASSKKRGKPRRRRAMSCFNLAAQYADEIEDDDNSISSTRSSISLR